MMWSLGQLDRIASRTAVASRYPRLQQTRVKGLIALPRKACSKPEDAFAALQPATHLVREVAFVGRSKSVLGEINV